MFRFTLTCLILLASSWLVGCAPPGDCTYGPFEDNTDDPGCRTESRRDSPAVLAIIQSGSVDQELACGVCGDANVLASLSGSRVKVTVVTQRSHILGLPEWADTSEETYWLAPGEKVFLGCTGGGQTANDCNISFSRFIKDASVASNDAPPTMPLDPGSRLANRIKLRAVSAAIRVQRLLNPPDSGELVCRQECDEQSPFCLALASDSTFRVEHFEAAANLLRPPQARVPMVDMLRIFDIPADPCNRTDTVIADGVLTNVGEECTLSADLEVDRSISASVQIPEVLRGSVTGADDTRMVVFPETTEAPFLFLTDVRLQDDWGGSIRRLEVTNGRAIVSTENGCISLRDAAPAIAFLIAD